MSQSQNHHFKLLVIDDDSAVLSFLRESFSRDGYQVQAASTLAEARALLARNEIHVILTDQNLPDGNGVDFLAEVHGTGIEAIPILMTGYANLNIALDAINRGKVYKFVRKPIDLILLRQIIRRAAEHYALLEEKKHLASEVLRYNQLLRRDSELQSRDLQSAHSKIQKHSQTLRKQKEQIEALYAEIQSAYLHTVTSLCVAIEAKDLYTRGHSDRIYHYCTLVGRRLGLDSSSFEELKLAGILHDIGKIGIPDSVLRKASALTDSEYEMIRKHLDFADRILTPLPFLEKTRRIVRQHHERYDGKGYPDGLKGEEISIEGRILAVADAYDAMRSDRAYRKALSKQAAIDQLEAESGKQFCPICVAALRMAIQEEGEYPKAMRVPTAPMLPIQPKSARARPRVHRQRA
jgi:response regulator RpfG family c-di-GMP phosphodiesterase